MNNLKIHKYNEPLSPDIDSAIRELLCNCFPADVEVFSCTRYWHDSVPTYSLVYWKYNRVAGHVGVVLRKIRVGEVSVMVAGIQNLAVAPELRGKGVGYQLMIEAMNEAVRLNIHYGLLFCLPELKRFYTSLGWTKTRVRVTMVDKNGQSVPILAKNIVMFKELAVEKFPEGNINLQGSDW